MTGHQVPLQLMLRNATWRPYTLYCISCNDSIFFSDRLLACREVKLSLSDQLPHVNTFSMMDGLAL
jgi:hypothetical protein